MEDKLTLEQVDALGDEFYVWFGDLALALAKYYAKVMGGEIYTQLNDEDGNPVYLKGIHSVNRTGVYGVRIPKERR
jgi:hypothetical protein